MYSYTMIQWLFFFYLYCFLGWCVESVYVSIRTRHLTNRGFMRGPFLPLYGSGAVMMLVVSMPFQDNVVMTYIAGCVGATVLEYITSVVMEALFKVRYWDYTRLKFNFQGRICLGTTLAWGILTIAMTEFIHVPIEMFVLSIPGRVLNVVTLTLTIWIVSDFALSFKAAVDLKEVLIKMEQMKKEMLHIQKRLESIMTAANREVENYKEALSESVSTVKESWNEVRSMRMEDVIAGIENKFENIKTTAQTRSSAYLESVKEELFELKTKYAINLELRRRVSGLKDFFQRNLLRGNPNMTSARFQEDLDELKKKAKEKQREKSYDMEKQPMEKENSSEEINSYATERVSAKEGDSVGENSMAEGENSSKKEV